MKRRFAVLVGCLLASAVAADGAQAKRYHRARAAKVDTTAGKATKVENLAQNPAAAAAAANEAALDPAAAAQPAVPATSVAVAAAVQPAPDVAQTPADPHLPTFLAMLFQPQSAAAPLAQPAALPPAAEPPAAEGTTTIARDTPLRQLVAKHAAANGVPFPLAHAVIMIESKYTARVAHAGNYGLMQIRAQTARGMGFSGSAAGLLDAETNLRFGMKYLALAYRMAHGDTCGTVMRYQSGTGTTRMSAANRAYCARARAYMAGL